MIKRGRISPLNLKKHRSALCVQINDLSVQAQTCSGCLGETVLLTRIPAQLRLRSAEGKGKREVWRVTGKALRETHSRLGRVCTEQWGVGREAALFKTSLISACDQELSSTVAGEKMTLSARWSSRSGRTRVRAPRRRVRGLSAQIWTEINWKLCVETCTLL